MFSSIRPLRGLSFGDFAVKATIDDYMATKKEGTDTNAVSTKRRQQDFEIIRSINELVSIEQSSNTKTAEEVLPAYKAKTKALMQQLLSKLEDSVAAQKKLSAELKLKSDENEELKKELNNLRDQLVSVKQQQQDSAELRRLQEEHTKAKKQLADCESFLFKMASNIDSLNANFRWEPSGSDEEDDSEVYSDEEHASIQGLQPLRRIQSQSGRNTFTTLTTLSTLSSTQRAVSTNRPRTSEESIVALGASYLDDLLAAVDDIQDAPLQPAVVPVPVHPDKRQSHFPHKRKSMIMKPNNKKAPNSRKSILKPLTGRRSSITRAGELDRRQSSACRYRRQSDQLTSKFIVSAHDEQENTQTNVLIGRVQSWDTVEKDAVPLSNVNCRRQTLKKRQQRKQSYDTLDSRRRSSLLSTDTDLLYTSD